MEEIKKSPLAAYVVPFALFMGGLALAGGVRSLGGKSVELLLSKPEYWVYPLQTLVWKLLYVSPWPLHDSVLGYTVALTVPSPLH